MLTMMLRRTARKTPQGLLWALGLLLCIGAHAARLQLKKETLACRAQSQALAEQGAVVADAASQFSALNELKGQDVAKFKQGLSRLADSKRQVYEAGMALQEEKRLLEKQLELLTTFLMVDMPANRIHRMRGEESVESFPIAGVRAAAGPVRSPDVLQIASKERFAHPERGEFIEKDGQLQWNPPQVGTSVRSNALGEYVIFAGPSVILHGPSSKSADHEAFAHYCLGLSAVAARKLYAGSFIGMKILFKPGLASLPLSTPAAAPVVPVAAAVRPSPKNR
ncbi:MAG: hypothetical protein WCU88_13220 [Elusimicrobiota bacterium]|jgi:hypothetical protein